MDNKPVDRITAPDVESFDQNTALNVMVQAIHIGQMRGAWRLEEAEILAKAIKAFIKKE